MANRRTLDEQIELALKEREQKDQHIKDLLARKRTKEDKERTHRLCKRGGLVEKLHPRLAKLTDGEFSLLVDLAIKSDHFKSALDEISPPKPDEAEGGNNAVDDKPISKPENGAAAPQGDDTGAEKTTEAMVTPPAHPAAKPANNLHSGGSGGNAHNGNRPPQNNNNSAHRPANNQHGNNGSGSGKGGNNAPRPS